MSNIDKQAQGEKTREAFERWAEQSGALPWGILKKHRNQDGTYPGPHYTYMWHAWNACHEALLDELEAKDKRIAELEAVKCKLSDSKLLSLSKDIVDNLVDTGASEPEYNQQYVDWTCKRILAAAGKGE